jgi:hypothetical protein
MFGFGVLGVGWFGLVAAIGIVETPASWCNEGYEPSGQLALHAGCAVAAGAVALSFVPALVSPLSTANAYGSGPRRG